MMVAILKEPFPSLRPMKPEDLDDVSKIEIEAYEFPWTHGIFRDCLRAGYECWVVVQGAEVIGYCVLSVAVREAHLLNMCIAQTHQSRGHGRHAMKRVVDLARWHHAERIFLEVRPSNPRAIQLYHDLGFNEIGRRPNYYPAKRGREDAIVMALEVLPPEA
jgi:[ribosomal protein S18]-alanine N-acetyltransferase